MALTTTIRSVVRPTVAPTGAALAGAAASAAFAVGDMLMLGRRVGPEDRRLLRKETDLNSAAGTLSAVCPDRRRCPRAARATRHVSNGAGLSLGMLTANVVAAAARRRGALH